MKLIGGKAREYLNSLLVHVNADPSYCQDKNGLAERHWPTMVSMAQNWLVSAELPSSFWFYAVRSQKKTDLRVLFKPFRLASVRREYIGDDKRNKFVIQSLPMIAIGHCPNSNGLQFYNTVNGTFVSSINYKLQPNITSGACFGYQYQPGTFINRLDESTSVFVPNLHLIPLF
jgi:hypothetical protein